MTQEITKKQIMGTFINNGNEAFRRARASEYVDKSGMISVINSTLGKENSYTCVTRCRRFGKSMAAEMLRAYYDESCDSLELFQDLQIADDESFLEHLNKYPVIYLDITSFTTKYPHDATIVQHIQDGLTRLMISSSTQAIFLEKKEYDFLYSEHRNDHQMAPTKL